MKKNTLSTEYLSTFATQLAMLIHAGIGIGDGLHMLAEDEEDLQAKELLKSIGERVDDGVLLSGAFEETGVFPDYVVYMTRTGEQTGRTEASFVALANHYERQRLLSERIRSALLYPLILLVLMILIIGVLLVKVLPIFNRVYNQLGGSMKGMAAGLLRFGDFLRAALPVLTIIAAIFVVFALVLYFSDSIREKCVSVLKKHFGDKGIIYQVTTARFASALSMGMMSGLTIENAMRTAMSFHEECPKLKERYEKCLADLETGEPLGDALRESQIFSTMYCRMISLGIRSGSADDIMEEISRRLDDDASRSIDRIVTKIEPTIVIVTSILVGMILLSVMIPLLNIMSSIG